MGKSIDLHADAFEAVQRWWRAWIERDSQVLEQMADADYAERNGRGRLQTVGSSRLIEIFSRECAECLITEWELSDPVTRLFEHVVVCSYVFRFSGKRGRQSFSYEGRATDVLSRQGDVWTLVAHEGVLEGGRRVG
jgi:hypothetical protein